MSFVIYDLVFLVVFALLVSMFLYRGRKNLQKEGILLLYKTKWGIKFIEYIGKKYEKTLNVLAYVSIFVGYVLMISVIYLFGKIIYLYAVYPQVVRAIKIPPIMPLIPYLPSLFKLDFLPPFYFTYWILILAIIAIPHEFAHGIFAKFSKVRIKSTGFGFFPFFFPVFLAAFVEQDEKQMKQQQKFNQIAILSAGTFANILTAILFFIILLIYFSLAFAPAGVQFDTYSYSFVAISNISMVNGISIENTNYEKLIELSVEGEFNKIKADERNFLIEKEFLESQEEQQTELFEKGYLILYDDAPAINSDLQGAISEINNIEIKNIEKFQEELSKYSPNEKIIIKTKIEEDNSVEEEIYEIVLGENPEKENVAWLGIGFLDQSRTGILGNVYSKLSSFKEPHVYYEPKINGLSIFIYDLLWWIILICVSVALVNMLPFGIFDGGMTFYLTILHFVKNEKTAKKIYSGVTYLFLLLILVLIFSWVLAFI